MLTSATCQSFALGLLLLITPVALAADADKAAVKGEWKAAKAQTGGNMAATLKLPLSSCDDQETAKASGVNALQAKAERKGFTCVVGMTVQTMKQVLPPKCVVIASGVGVYGWDRPVVSGTCPEPDAP